MQYIFKNFEIVYMKNIIQLETLNKTYKPFDVPVFNKREQVDTVPIGYYTWIIDSCYSTLIYSQ